MKHYLSLARRYRPVNFSELYGQDILCKTISNAIINNRLPQAYLLTGTRGIGKTTAARIIAKNINCLNNTKDNNNYIVACDSCINCLSSINGNHPDIIEIDAASNTSVENIKEIIVNSEYRPVLGNYKVFIIDEVHMLSKSAFNALLKTLEEPFPHVVFIFATTEPNKIPLTIASRCQSFALRRLSLEDLISLLKNICKKEKVTYDENALKYLALKADGSARDALSLLDQIILLASDNYVKTELINETLGLGNKENVFRLVVSIVKCDYQKVLNDLDTYYQNNTDLVLLMEEIIKILSYICKIKVIDGYKDIEYSQFDDYVCNLVNELDLMRINLLWQIFINGYRELKNAFSQLLIFEMILIKAIYSNTLPVPKEVIANIPISVNNTVLEVLDYLKSIKNFSLYKYLFEEVEIIQCYNGIIELSEISDSEEKNKELIKVLEDLYKTKWKIFTVFKKDPIIFKKKLLDIFIHSKEWDFIRSSFDKTEIIDILYKT